MSSITRVRGDDWAIAGTISAGGAPVDLTSATITSQIRRTADSATVTETFTVTKTNAAAGEITLSLSDTETALIKPGAYVYDLQVVIGSTTTTYGAGSPLVVKADVTR